MIGTPIWRILNYGITPTLKYFATNRLGLKSQYKNLEALSLSDLAKSIGLKEENSESISRKNVQPMVQEMRERVKLDLEERKIKDVLKSESSIARLIILELVIRSSRFGNFLETGTQHGLSAFIANESAKRSSLKLNVVSFDISHEQYFVRSTGVTYSTLTWPVRKNFKRGTLNLPHDRLLFFHDSDHSYENMSFEFQWAWNHLKAEAIISDDIDTNDAFFDFCKSTGITGYRIMIDKGPAVGFAMRGLSG